MKRRSRATVLALLVVMLGTLLPALPAAAATITTRAVVRSDTFPAAFTFAPDGRLFWGERFTGRIHVRNLATGADTIFYDIANVATEGEQGLLGLAVHPDFPSVPSVYAYVSRTINGDTRNEVLRINKSGGRTRVTSVLRAPAASNHNGGRLLFGPDRMLYLVVGDTGSPQNSQDLASNSGKILRFRPDGGGKTVFASGFRNSFGFDFDPQGGRLWETENGPSCNDELNLVTPGANYGWGPSAACASPPQASDTNRDGPNPVFPQRIYNPPPALTGAAFCDGCRLGPDYAGRLLAGAFGSRDLTRVALSTDRTSVAAQRVVYTHRAGIVSIEAAPDGRLYLSDANGIYRLETT